MKQVMVPIDFSETSLSALKYGIVIANKLSADLRIVYVMSKGQYAIGFEPESTNTTNPSRLLDKLLLEYRQQYYVANGKFDYKIREGQVSVELSNQVHYDDTTIVVMGSHGVSGITESWIGSNAYRMLSSAPCPVLIIRPDMNLNVNFSRIAITIDINKSSRLKLPIAAGVAKILESKVILVGLQHSKWRGLFSRLSQSVKQAETYFSKTLGIEVEKSILLDGDGLAERVVAELVATKADILAIDVKNTGYFFSDRFRPFLIALVNKSKCPVLAIPIKE